eukprot:scaffold25.g5102.t1
MSSRQEAPHEEDVEFADAAEHHNNREEQERDSSTPPGSDAERPRKRAHAAPSLGHAPPVLPSVALGLSQSTEAEAEGTAEARAAGAPAAPAAAAPATCADAVAAVLGSQELGAWQQMVAKAEGLLRSGQWEQAIEEYGHLIRTALPLLSESRALYAPDPCHLAALALKDADASLALDAGALGQLARGRALLLLERYCEAESALAAGLQARPTLPGLWRQLQDCHAAAAAALASGAGSGAAAGGGGEARAARVACSACSADDAECTLCMRLLWEPVTTPCGHSFCRPCYQRSTDHTSRCPLCRTVLHAGRDLPVTVVLKALLEASFPGEYAARGREEAAAAGEGGAAPLPLFVMSPMLPGERMALNIFEPRYRLMVRRCMEGSRRFGMATVDGRHELHPVACEVEITECQPQPDGRFYIEIVGRRRFRPAATWEQASRRDGYRVAQPEYICDEPPAAAVGATAGGAAAEQLAELAAEVSALADGWVDRLRGLVQACAHRLIRARVFAMRRGVAELLHRAGDRPPPSDPQALSFWVLLGGTSTLERLQQERQLLQQLGRAQCSGCSVM